jgi:hypothetical protein
VPLENVSESKTKWTHAATNFRNYQIAPPELPTPQDYQPYPLVPSLAASTFTFGALSWRYRELKFQFRITAIEIPRNNK